MFKKNEENQSIEGSDAELMFSNSSFVKLLLAAVRRTVSYICSWAGRFCNGCKRR